jgi:NIMA (never in mitosis gene a)-related kinase
MMLLLTILRPVFLGENNSVKLGDFGLSKIIASHDFASTYVGTPFYMSPEICAAERYSHHSDIWSLGCIIYELASRGVPFDARNHVELIMKIKAGKIKPLPSQYSKDLGDVIAWCLKVDPRYRPDTAQLLNVANVKLARSKLQQLEQSKDIQLERDAALRQLAQTQAQLAQTQTQFSQAQTQLAQAQKQIQELRSQVEQLKAHDKQMEMEWHTRATLAIDQRVHDQVEAKKAELLQQFEEVVDQRAEEKLGLHLASLPASHGLSAGESTHVRSSTPPPGKTASFATTATTTYTTDGSSVPANIDDSALETDITGLSLQDEPDDEVSPLARRIKPLKAGSRKPMGRAKTFANHNLNSMAVPSPMDVHMADPSPMPQHVAPMSIKGLSLSPRKNGQERLSGAANLRRNIFCKEQNFRPRVKGDDQNQTDSEAAFADDDESDGLEDDRDIVYDLGDSPSRPSSGLSNHGAGADPFKVLSSKPTQPRLAQRPSLARQQTMPVNFQGRNQNTQPNIFNTRPAKSPEREKENRPPSSHARNASAVPVLSGSPKRIAQPKDPKALTPSRKAPPPPTDAGFTKHTKSPAKIQGRTLVQLQQARSQPCLLPTPLDSDFDSDASDTVAAAWGGPRLLPSPAKWDAALDGEEMPSPFLAKKGGRVMVR